MTHQTTPIAADIAAIRERAHSNMRDGAITSGYRADPEKVIEVLNAILATEIVCVRRYKHHCGKMPR